MEDLTATYASANWIRQPQPLEPFHQLGGVLPAKRMNTEFLDYTNTWLVTTNVDYRPASFQVPGAYATNARPAYLREPGELPARCQTANDARLRRALEFQ